MSAHRTGPAPLPDPALLQVAISQLAGVAEEMGAVPRRAAFSPNIKERADCSAALFTPAGEQLVQAEHIPVHLGSMPASVAAAIRAFSGRELRAGDQILLNDPFAGGTHLNDLTLVAPCIIDGRLIGWAANRAHHADVGGMVPGSIAPDATEIYQEGLRIPPILLTDDVVALLQAASRTPDERRGDLDAQIGANVVGVGRLAELGRGLPVSFDDVLRYGERRMRAAVAAIPDGQWTFADAMDSCGPRPDQQEPARIVVTVTVAGDEIVFDFNGTAAQRQGNVNAVAAVTVSAAVFALRCVTDPTIPANGGSLRALSVLTPEGSIVAARPPVAVGAGNVEVSQRVADVCLGALAQALPGRVGAANQGTMNNLIVGGANWVYYETIGGGQGGRPGRPAGEGAVDAPLPGPRQGAAQARGVAGQSAIHTGMTNTRNTPVEALERGYPMRVLCYAIRRGSGGSGLAGGGDGIWRDLQVLEDCTVSLITERRTSQPWGLAGGGAGATGENWLLPRGEEDQAQRLGDKCTLVLRPGDVIRMLTPGGGGWGTP